MPRVYLHNCIKEGDGKRRHGQTLTTLSLLTHNNRIKKHITPSW